MSWYGIKLRGHKVGLSRHARDKNTETPIKEAASYRNILGSFPDQVPL